MYSNQLTRDWQDAVGTDFLNQLKPISANRIEGGQ
jgi:hypothetical protein